MTDSCKRWPKWLLEQATAPPPEGCEGLIVPDSTPVVSFGNPMQATVATIGLNPSALEFLESWGGPMLPEDQRRLAVRESAEISDCRLGAKILDGCAGYFGRNPYEGWFLPLDCILRTGARASYYADTRFNARYLDLACHIDLSPWATSDSWTTLKRGGIHKKLLADKLSSLRQLISQGHYRLVIINGSGVKEEMDDFQFLSINWCDLKPLEKEQCKHTKQKQCEQERCKPGAKLHEAVCGDTLFLAWSCNIQRQRGADRHIPELARFVAERYDKFLRDNSQNERRTT